MSYMGEQPIFGSYPSQLLSGDGSTTSFTLTYSPASPTTLLVTISGVKQQAGAYSVTDTTIDFGAGNAPPTGTNNIEVLYLGQRVDVGSVGDGAISTAKIADSAVTIPKLSDFVFTANRNILINGTMEIAQRSTSVASVSSNGYRAVDRWKYFITTAGTSVFTCSQETDAPAGFGFSSKIIMTTADTIEAGTENNFTQGIEGFNLQQIKKGTASAEQLTVSWWIKSVTTGTYICEMLDNDNDRVCCLSYTVSAANTWEYKTLTFPADTTGAFGADSGKGLTCRFWLRAGTNFTSGTLPTTWEARVNADRAVGQVDALNDIDDAVWITGVQLEIGTNATPYEHKTFGQELAACQRYYQQYGGGPGSSADAENGMLVGRGNGTADLNNVLIPLTVPLRANPTLSTSPGSGSATLRWYNAGTGTISTYSVLSTAGSQPQLGWVNFNVNGFGSSLTSNGLAGLVFQNTFLQMDSEL